MPPTLTARTSWLALPRPTGMVEEEPLADATPLPSARWPWLLLTGLLLVQFLLFRQFVEREIAWMMPRSFDQSAYLLHSYQTYEVMVERGLWKGLETGLRQPVPNGLLLHVQGALMHFLFGPSRMSALSLNFVYYALLQLAVVAVLHWTTRRWSVAFLGLGLLLAALSPFGPCGGMDDFRIDFIAFCLYGVWMCTLVRSGFFQSRRWSLVVGVMALVIVLFRYITFVSIVTILGAYLVLLTGRWLRTRRDRELHAALGHQIRNLVSASVICLVFAVPVLLWRARALYSYYVVNYILGGDHNIRAAELGLHSLIQHVSYYPLSVLFDHSGISFLVLGGFICALGLLLRWLKPMAREEQASPLAPGLPIWLYFAVAGLVPLGIMTVSISKSPITGNIIVQPLFWLLLLPLVAWAQARKGVSLTTERWLAGVAGVGLFVGMNGQLHAASIHRSGTLHPYDTEQMLALIQDLRTEQRNLSVEKVRVASDTLSDWLYSTTMQVYLYERERKLVDLSSTLGSSLFAIGEKEALASLAEADFAILQENYLQDKSSVYPFHHSMQQVHPQLRRYCQEHFTLKGKYVVHGDTYLLYVRPYLQVKKCPWGWVTPEGITLTGTSKALQRFPVVELQGGIPSERFASLPGIAAQFRLGEAAPRTIPAKIQFKGNAYTIRLRIDPKELSDQDAPVEIRIVFDRFFRAPMSAGHEDEPLAALPPSTVRLYRSLPE